jgi:hypothetical protein
MSRDFVYEARKGAIAQLFTDIRGVATAVNVHPDHSRAQRQFEDQRANALLSLIARVSDINSDDVAILESALAANPTMASILATVLEDFCNFVSEKEGT